MYRSCVASCRSHDVDDWVCGYQLSVGVCFYFIYICLVPLIYIYTTQPVKASVCVCVFVCIGPTVYLFEFYSHDNLICFIICQVVV